jgi:hypothetical protein
VWFDKWWTSDCYQCCYWCLYWTARIPGTSI